MKPKASKHLFIFWILILIISFLHCQRLDSFSSSLESCEDIVSNIAINKQRGAHIFGILDTVNFKFLRQNHVEWVTLVSWGFQDDFDSPKVNHHNGDSIMIKNSDANWVRRIQKVRSAGFKVFIKPHVWINSPTNNTWRPDVFPTNKKNWQTWSSSYRNFILRYAKIAEITQAEMFCIGTEFSKLSTQKPAFWKQLIKDIRKIYSGKLTYAANWYDEFEKISFWEDLDYVGIQAYFPLTKHQNPSIQQIAKGWNKYLRSMKSIYKKSNRQVLFTELGYKSTTDSAITPWEWMDDPYNPNKSLSLETQANCYKAFFNQVWNRKWFAGVHIWSMRIDDERWIGENNKDFSPIGKPAEHIIAKGFEVR